MIRILFKRLTSCFGILAFGICFIVFPEPETQVGYSVLTAASGQHMPVAMALFTYSNAEGTLVSEAGVAATETLSSGRIFVDQDGVETGIALVNPSSQPANITLILRDSSGSETGRQQLPLGAGNHTAQFVSQLFAGIAAGFTGSLTFESSQKLAAITLRQSKNIHGEPLYTTLPVVDLSKPATGESLLFPQIAAGDGYSTQVILVNSTAQPERGQIRLYGDDGEPLALQAGSSEASQFPYDLPTNGTGRVEFNLQQGARVGYALVVPDPGTTVPIGSAVFRYTADGNVVTEAGVGASQATTSARIFVDNVGCYTGVAFVNRGGQTANLSFTLLDRSGLVLETQTRTLAANGHVAVFAHELFPGLSDKFAGLMEISSTTPVAQITLKLVVNERRDLVYTTFPVADLTRLPSATSLVFPQIAFGGGFSTRLILISTEMTVTSAGSISFYKSTSAPMILAFGNQTGGQFPYQLPEGGGMQFFPGNPVKIASIALWDPQDARVTSQVAVNEGNRIRLPLLVLDETGMPRDDFQLSYVSINPEVATVEAGGYVTGRKKGFSTLTVSSGGVIATGTIMVASVQQEASSNFIPTPRGIVQDMAQGIYLAVPQEHTLVFVREPGQAPETYAGMRGTAGFRNDVRSSSLFNGPSFLALNQAQGSIYASDSANNVIRRVNAGPNGKVETFAGTGAKGSSDGGPTSVQFNNPQGIAMDRRGYLWVSDSGNNIIRRINLSTGATETIAGKAGNPGWADGKGDQARFNTPMGIAVEPEYSIIPTEWKPVSVIVADTGNGLIRRVKETGEVETISAGVQASQGYRPLAGEASPAPLQFSSPTGVTVDPLGNIYVSEPNKGRVRVILTTGDVVAATQMKTLTTPAGMAMTQSGKVVVTDGQNAAQVVSYGEPQITSIQPGKVSVNGGERVTISGSNFAPDSIVIAAGKIMESIVVRDSQTIEFNAAAGLSSGLSTLTVQNRSGLAQKSIFVEPQPVSQLPPGYIATFAGGTTYAEDGALAVLADLDPRAVALDPAGNLFIAESDNHRIRKVAVDTHIITTVAGTGDAGFSGDGGPATAAMLNSPYGVTVDSIGNLFIADSTNHRVRKVAAETGIITTLAGNGGQGFSGDGGPATAATLYAPRGVAVDTAGNLYVAEYNNHRIRRIAAESGLINTVAGNGTAGFSGDGGPATAATLNHPWSVAVDPVGNVFIADNGSDRIRKVAAGTGIITTVAGNGQRGFSGDGGLATAAQIAYAQGVAVDVAGNLFIADTSNNRIRKVTADSGIITTVGGYLSSSPLGVACDPAGNLFIACGRQVLKVATAGGTIVSVAGTSESGSLGDGGPAAAAKMIWPWGLAVDSAGNLFIVDNGNTRMRKVAAETGIITTAAGTGGWGFSGDGGPATAARLLDPRGLACDFSDSLYIADTANCRIRKVSAGIITTAVGNGRYEFSGDGGPATAAGLEPQSVAVNSMGDLFIADMVNNRIRKVTARTGIISTAAGTGERGFSGDGGPATAAKLNWPTGVAADANGNLFVADWYNLRIRRIAADTGVISTVAGNGTNGFSGDGGPAIEATLGYPTRVTLDSLGNLLIVDWGNCRIRRVAAATGIITTVAGNGRREFFGDYGPATAAGLRNPDGVAVDSSGNLFIADTRHNRVRIVRGPLP